MEQKKEAKHELSSNASSLIVVNTAVFLGRKKTKIYDEHTYIHPLLKSAAEVSAVISVQLLTAVGSFAALTLRLSRSNSRVLQRVADLNRGVAVHPEPPAVGPPLPAE